jgi:hypothetical protein
MPMEFHESRALLECGVQESAHRLLGVFPWINLLSI